MKMNVGRLFAIKISVSFIPQFWSLAGYVVFFAAWLAHNGLDEYQIALILGVSQALKNLLAPFTALWADGFKLKKTPILYMNILGVLSVLLLFYVDQYVSIFLITIFFALSSSAIVPILDGLSMKGAERYGFDYGHTRLWGSLAFIVSSILCGIYIEYYGYDVVIIWLLIGAVLALIAGLFLPILPEKVKLADVGLDSSGDSVSKRPTRGKFDLTGALILVKQPIFISILVTVAFIFASHAVYYGFSTIHWAKLGYSGRMIGLLWSVGVLAEVVLFMFSNKLANLMGPRRLLIWAAIAALVRWAITALDPALYWLFIVQILHAFTFAAAYLASLHLITRSVPEDLISTAMAISASINSGIFMAAAMFVGGLLYAEYLNHAYWFSVALAFVGLLMGLALKFVWNGEALKFMRIKK